MKQSVIDALNRVASISAEAAALVDQVRPEKETEEVTLLKNSIVRLTSEVALLRMEAQPDYSPVSDEDALSFAAGFVDYLNKLPDLKAALIGYNRNFFLPYSAPVRVVIATTLLNYCTKNNLTSSDLWSDIVANMGYL